jgi:2-polyprenyl-3-methyl-5-hydroxy-6-metoxy-1,4-benzoquinol methylase
MIKDKTNFESVYKEKLDNFNQSDNYQLDVNEILSELSKFSFNSIMDIGCGTGYLIKILKKVYPACILKGMDKFQFGTTNHDILDISNTNFKYNQKFDVIIMMHSINHIVNLKIACNNINNLLNKGGKIIIINPGKNFMNIIKKLQDLNLREKTVGDNTVVNYLSIEEISEKFNLFNINLIFKKVFGNPMIIKHRDENYKMYPRILMIFKKN